MPGPDMIALPTARLRILTAANGTSGASLRVSMIAKQASRAAEAHSAAMTVPDRQPSSPACETPYVFQTWTLKNARSMYWKTGIDRYGTEITVCTVTGRVVVQELGKHGVTLLKASRELKGPNCPGWLPSYASTAYGKTLSFPNDEVSHHHVFELAPGHLTFVKGGIYALWGKTAGQRAWRKDFTRHFSIGDVSDCERAPGKINFGD